MLKGREKIDSWLRGEAGAVLGAAVSPKTVEQYKRNGARLHAAREGQARGLVQARRQLGNVYAYRAAVRWYAATEGIKAVREYSAAAKFGLEDAKAAAWQRVLHFAADLVQYPKDAKPGLPSARAVALGLDDPKPEGAPARAKREGGQTPKSARRRSSKPPTASPANTPTGVHWCGRDWWPSSRRGSTMPR